MDLELTYVCYICGNSMYKQDKRIKCKCKNRVCRECWKSVMCIDCFDKLPYDKKELVENFDVKLKKRGNMIRILMYIMFPAMILGIPIFNFPFWTMLIYVGFMIVFAILFYIIPLNRFKKSLERNYN